MLLNIGTLLWSCGGDIDRASSNIGPRGEGHSHRILYTVYIQYIYIHICVCVFKPTQKNDEKTEKRPTGNLTYSVSFFLSDTVQRGNYHFEVTSISPAAPLSALIISYFLDICSQSPPPPPLPRPAVLFCVRCRKLNLFRFFLFFPIM